MSIIRSNQCISCGQCIEACVYGVHDRHPRDVRRMNEPNDYLCRACFRCIQECPRQALTIAPNATFLQLGRGPFTAEVISSLMRQADDGRIPVLGAGYRGAFAGPGFDSMWTDMSEIVRPTRDGIHGREYISTAVDLGARPLRLDFNAPLPRSGGGWEGALPPAVEIPLPLIFNELPLHRFKSVTLALLRAAHELNTFAIVRRSEWQSKYAPFAHHVILHLNDASEIDEFVSRFRIVRVDDPSLVARIKAVAPETIVMVRCSFDAERVEQLARDGAEVIHIAANWDGAGLIEQLPQIHQRLLDTGQRDTLTLIASGGIAMAEHLPKTIILGADALAIDLPLLVALECLLQDECFQNNHCARGLEAIDPAWGAQRIVNLMASWRNQLLEVLGAMGMREVRRLRGERGRAMWKSELDEKLIDPIFEMTGNT